jgi:hypothetical protein
MSTTVLTRRGYTTVAVVGALAVALGIGSLRVLSPETSGAVAIDRATPAWFKPIADYYGNNPKVTPRFQFADLYTGDPVWFGPVAEYYHFAPGVTSAYDFAALFGPAGAGTTP